MEMKQLKETIWEYKECFSINSADIRRCIMNEANLETKPNHEASWTPPRTVPYTLQGKMYRHIHEMVKTGIVGPCPEDYESERWNSPIFLVSKKGGSYRFITDLREVNEQLLDNNYPLNNINQMLDEINRDTIFSTFDFSQSFFQVPYDKDSRK